MLDKDNNQLVVYSFIRQSSFALEQWGQKTYTLSLQLYNFFLL